MTAIFFARADSSDEYKQYEEFAENHDFIKRNIMYGDKRSDSQLCWFRLVGEDDACVLCQSAKGEDFLLFNGFNQDDSRKKRIWALMNYGKRIATSNNADRRCVYLFWHNGRDIPKGYEAWANAVIKECKGFEAWRLALLSSAREGAFDLRSIGTAISKDAFNSGVDFRKWINELDVKLRGVFGDECS